MGAESYLKPPRLRPGSRVALLAPAGPISVERVQRALDRCRALELDASVSPSARLRLGYLAGPDEARAADLRDALLDESIDAVWALRGGYGTMRILPALDFGRLEAPKAFIGFSDNTTLHLALAREGRVSFHGPHIGFDRLPAWSIEQMRRVLFQAEAAGVLDTTRARPRPERLIGGVAEGRLAGGNLSLLAAACGTDFRLRARGCILIVEDVSEPVYRIDRMLTQLRLARDLDGVRGIAFGRFTKMRPSREGRSLEDVLLETAEALGVPAVHGMPIGHVARNWTVPLGCHARLDADRCTLEILEPAVT